MTVLSRELSDLAGQWVLQPSVVSLGPAPPATVIVAANPLRWGLWVSLLTGAGAEVTLAPDPLVSVSRGFYLAGPGNLDWNVRKWGGLVQATWYGSADVVHPLPLYVFEILVQQ